MRCIAKKNARFLCIFYKGQPCLKEICEFFGKDILLENGILDRPKLAGLVFTDKKKLELLNSITYPYITSEILKTIRRLSFQGNKLILLDAPTLFESRADDFCELIISVISRDNLRLERIVERDKISRESAQYRMDSQLKEEFFRQNSDFIIKNNSDINNLYEVTREVTDKIKDYYNNKYKS